MLNQVNVSPQFKLGEFRCTGRRENEKAGRWEGKGGKTREREDGKDRRITAGGRKSVERESVERRARKDGRERRENEKTRRREGWKITAGDRKSVERKA